MEAEQLFYRKNIEPGGDIIEIKIWRVPHPKTGIHDFKYSLVYIQNGKRALGYDNAHGKGDHKHYWQKEFAYHFTDIYSLIEDFYGDVERVRRGEL